MMDKKFKEIIQSNTGCTVILAGSNSDKKQIDKVIESLDKYEIPYQVRICSAHKQPIKLMEIIKEYNQIEGSISYVAIAGGTDALSGMLSYHALGPVISCPPDAPNQSCLTNPPGSSNVYISKPGNVGKFIAQMYSGINPKFKKLLKQNNAKKVNSLEESDINFQKMYEKNG